MKRVMLVFGTRPEAIKMAPVALTLSAHPDIDCRICVTGQHREMLDQVLKIFAITPHYDLAVMRPNQDLYDVTANVLLGMRDVLRSERPDVVLVHGDTTTCFAGALSAFYERIPIGHVEAGLRSGDLFAPYPEEANRALVGRITDFNFAPTEGARDNLLREGAREASVWVTGNTAVDAILLGRDKARAHDKSAWNDVIGTALMARIEDPTRRLVLITGHRRENFGQGFVDLCNGIRTLAEAHADWDFVYPVHLNPNVQRPVHDILGALDNVHLIAPLEYLPFVWTMDHADILLTDSGGIQEEAPSLGKPVLVMRDVTERPEALNAGTARLVGTAADSIVRNVEELLTNEATYAAMSSAVNPYGDGRAAERIAEALLALDS